MGVVAATDSETGKPPTVKDVGEEGATRGGGWTPLDNFLGDAEQARFSQARLTKHLNHRKNQMLGGFFV